MMEYTKLSDLKSWRHISPSIFTKERKTGGWNAKILCNHCSRILPRTYQFSKPNQVISVECPFCKNDYGMKISLTIYSLLKNDPVLTEMAERGQ